MPQSFIVDSVVKAVRNIPGYRKLRILDLSCGEGDILDILHAEGCDVQGTHHCPHDYIIQNPAPVLSKIKIHKNVSLDKPLPFDTESYDIVMMTEVIEHIPNHFDALKEVARITARGGRLILTTPNISRLHSRLSFLFSGAHKLIRRRIGWDTAFSDLYQYHINPIDFTVFHSLLHMLGFSIESTPFTRIKKRHLYLLLLYPLIRTASAVEYRAVRENALYREGESDLRKRLRSLPLLCSEQLMVVAKKD